MPGLGILTTVSEALDDSRIGELLIETTVPLVLTILGPLLPTDITSVLPGGIPTEPGARIGALVAVAVPRSARGEVLR